MYSMGIAAQILGACIKTLRRWNKKNLVTCFRTKGGHRRFTHQEIERVLQGEPLKKSKGIEGVPKKCAIYGRVSSHKQKKRGDLRRQIEGLKAHAKNLGYLIYSVYSDIGSGLNTNRKGLWRLIRDCRAHEFSIIFINFKDRLTRFGYRYIEEYVSEFGIRLICIHRLEENTPESELVEDLVAIVHSFSGKMYRMRRKEKTKN